MKTIEQFLNQLSHSLDAVTIRSSEHINIEFWTTDGKLISDAGRGVKVSIPFKEILPSQKVD